MGIMIRRVWEDGGERVSAPVMVCDTCGEIIRRAADGNYVWDGDAVGKATLWEERPTAMARLYFVHKGVCDNRDRWECSAELRDLPLFLANNLQIDLSQAFKERGIRPFKRAKQ